MKLITTDIAIEAVVRFIKRNYHKFTKRIRRAKKKG